MRLALLIHALTPGGAERVLSVLANHWADRGHEVRVFTLAGVHKPFYPLRPAIQLEHLGLAAPSGSMASAMANNGRRVLTIRRVLRAYAPDVVVPFMTETNVLVLLASCGLGLPVIATEHTVPGLYHIGRQWELLRRMLYRLAARVVVPTRRGAEDMSRFAKAKYTAIPNPVAPVTMGGEGEGAVARGPFVLAVGRLSWEKGYGALLRAFASIAPRHPGWSLAILGEGPLRGELSALAESLGVTDRLLLPGNVEDPFAWMRRADLFALTSHFEGFSNALAEALASGLPAVAVDCPHGPAEILTHGQDGVLVPPNDEGALAEALSWMMGDGAARSAMAARAPEAMERFGLAAVGAAWDGLFAEILKK